MKSLLFTTFLFFSLQLSAQQLQQHRWKNRLLIIVDKEIDSKDVLKQLSILDKNRKGLEERRLIVYQFSSKGYKRAFDTNNNWSPISKDSRFPHQKNNNFTIYLIGLDGGIKMERHQPVKSSTIFSLIDGMPMRRAELKKG